MTEWLFGTGAVLIALAGMLGSVAFAVVVIQPRFGAYLLLVINPLIVGIARGDTIGALRPNELLLILIAASLAARTLLLMLAGRYHRPSFDSLDFSIVLLALTSSILPLLVQHARGSPPLSTDDLLYSLVFWKYFLLYRILRSSITRPAEVEACLWLSMISAAAVAVIGICQVLDLFGIPEFLNVNYDQPFSGSSDIITSRASSTIGSTFGFADVMIMNSVIVIAMLHMNRGRRWLLVAASVLFVSGCIAAGEFSSLIGLSIALLTFGFISGRLQRVMVVGVPGGALAATLFWPVIQTRLSEFEGATGLPPSWIGRWENLQRFFLPELVSNLGWLLGVRPAARIPAPERWREFVYIESGYIWLLWIGGIPFLLAYVYFAFVAMQRLWRVTREQCGAIWVAATASFAYLMVIIALMLFDAHLTIRGSADLFFPLLAISFARPRAPQFAK